MNKQNKVDNNVVDSMTTTTIKHDIDDNAEMTTAASMQQQTMKLKSNRQPIDDLLLEDPKVVSFAIRKSQKQIQLFKELTELERIDGLSLTSRAFADILMVMEFVNNFGHVLKIGK